MNPAEQRRRPEVTLELLVKKGNQQWSSYGCYSPQEKQLAMEEAQKLDKDPHTLSVKLVKETYNPEDNTSAEVTLFASSDSTNGRWASGFEHRKGDRQVQKSDEAAKGATGGKQKASSQGRPGLFETLCAIVRSLFTLGARPRPGRSAKSTGAQKTSADKKTDPAKTEEDSVPKLRGVLEVIMEFIASALAVLDQNALNTFNRFGICLYIGGASNLLCRREELSTEDTATVLSNAMFAVGLSKERATRFHAEYEAYLLESAHNMQMFQAGHDAMIAYLGDGVTGECGLEAALKVWNEQKLGLKHAMRRPLTLMFTDMVGSSALAEERGDELAKKVVRVHNMIVKSTISHYGGHYVEYTGDGIVAAYDDAQMAVKSAAVIQRCVREHNTQYGDLPLNLRVGLHGGDTITEGEDAFGSSINLASRVCALAGSGQIFCTKIVRNRAKAGKTRFADRGEQAVKGYNDPIPVYEILWDDGQATAAEVGEQKDVIGTHADAAE